MIFLQGNSDVLERLAVEMYTRGLSTRDMEDALEEATGDRLLSRTAGGSFLPELFQEAGGSFTLAFDATSLFPLAMLLSSRRKAHCTRNLVQLPIRFCFYFCDTLEAGRCFLKLVLTNGLSKLRNGRYRFRQTTDRLGEI